MRVWGVQGGVRRGGEGGADLGVVPLREVLLGDGAADGAEEDPIRLLARQPRRFGEVLAVRVERRASDVRGRKVEAGAEDLAGAREDLERLGHDLGADAIARQHGHLERPRLGTE